MSDLFELATDSAKRSVRHLKNAARKLEIASAIIKYGIKTHCGKDGPIETKWLAVAPFDKNDPRDCARLMLDECRLLDEAGRVCEGRTQYEAVMGLSSKLDGMK